MDRLLQMIINTVLRQLINRGVKTGIDLATKGKSTGGQGASPQSRDMAKKARSAINLARRLGK